MINGSIVQSIEPFALNTHNVSKNTIFTISTQSTCLVEAVTIKTPIYCQYLFICNIVLY